MERSDTYQFRFQARWVSLRSILRAFRGRGTYGQSGGLAILEVDLFRAILSLGASRVGAPQNWGRAGPLLRLCKISTALFAACRRKPRNILWRSDRQGSVVALIEL
jgi:hypothetical protein